MKTILVPVDFSENSDNALYYAIDIAKKIKAQLILLNVYEIEYANSYVPADFIIEEKKDKKKDSLKQLEGCALKIKHAGKIDYDMLSVEGFIVDVILDVIEQKRINLVVMGTKGAGNFTNAILGSNTAKIIEKSNCPVIAVPEQASFKGIQKITYATMYHHSDIKALETVVEIFKIFDAKITVLHVSESFESREDENEAFKEFRKDVLKKISYDKLLFQILRSEDVETALDEYINDGKVDMLVMSAHHRDFFDKLFGKSVTKHMVYHTAIPLMVFHHYNDSSIRFL